MKVIGITGGVGSGKSEVLKFLAEREGVVVCQADEVAKAFQKKGTECFDKIVAHFGPEVVGKEGELNRRALADIVFHSAEELKCLNGIVHPAVEAHIREWIQKERENQTKIFFLENALLLDLKHDEMFCDEIWYIYTSDDVRVKRLKLERGYSEEKSEAIFRAQKSKEEFMEKCDRVIDNSRSFEETCVQLLHVLDKLQ